MEKKLTTLFIATAFVAGALSSSIALVAAQDKAPPSQLQGNRSSEVIELAPPAPKVKQRGRRYEAPSGPIELAKYPQRGIIIGQVIELSTYAMYAGHENSERYAGASRRRAEQGFPVGIIEESTGDVYIALHKKTAPASPLGPANTKLAPYMGKRIVAAGLRYRNEGVNLFRISVMSEY